MPASLLYNDLHAIQIFRTMGNKMIVLTLHTLHTSLH